MRTRVAFSTAPVESLALRQRRSVRPGFLILLLGALLGSHLPVAAQVGSLAVRIEDATSLETLPGVSVLLTSKSFLVAPTALRTDKNGEVQFPVLKSGSGYVLEISTPGYARQRIPDIRVSSGETRQIILQLSPELRETVRVSGQRDIVDIEKTQASTRFTDEFIEQLPVPGRFYQNILRMAPGVNDADEDGNPNVHGARTRDFKAEVSGVSNVDPLTGERLSFVNTESIEDMEVIQAGAGVEFGRAQGGFARIVQKQGTNELEGVFTFIYASSDFDGNGATNVPESAIPEFELVQPGFQLSGPIIKDKLWYRLSHEYIDRQDPVNLLNSVQTTELKQQINSDQLTWQASPRNKLTFQFQSDPLEQANIGLSSTVSIDSTQSLDQGGDIYSISWIAPYSSRLLFDSVAAYQDHSFRLFPTSPGAPQDCVDFEVFLILNNTRCFFSNTATTTGGHPESWSDKRQRLTVRSQATWYMGNFAGMSHQLRFGFIVENERYFRDLERGPDMQFSTFRPFFGEPTGFASVQVPVPSTSNARTTGNSWGVFVEEKFKPTGGLAITVGVRVDKEVIRARGLEQFDPAAEASRFFKIYESGANPQFIPPLVFTHYPEIREFQANLAEAMQVPVNDIPLDATAIQSAFWSNTRELVDIDITDTNVSPRLSIAWDPWANGKTKIALAAGRYHDKIFLAVPMLELEPITTDLSFIARIPWLDPDVNHFVVNSSENSVSAIVNTKMVDRNLQTPYQDEFMATIERSLWPETSVKLTYIERKFEDQLQDVDINHRDEYVLNPAWGEILLLGNTNTADYKGVVVELNRRQYRGWQMHTSYTWSEAIGDAEDFTQLLGNNRGLLESERGYLSYDQRHIVRLNATTITPWGWRLGTAARWESGLPYSIVIGGVTLFTNPDEYANVGHPVPRSIFLHPTGKRNDQRNESFWTIDIRASKELFLRGGTNLQLTGEVFNVMNDDRLLLEDQFGDGITATRRFGRRYQVGMRLAF